MRFANPDDATRCALIRGSTRIAVVGLSPNPSRPSHGVARALQGFGFTVVPVRPGVREVLGEKAYARLADVPGHIDLVDVFRTPSAVDAIVEECLQLGIKAIWLQDGVVNEAAAARARAGGMTVVMDRCIYRDYVRICGRSA